MTERKPICSPRAQLGLTVGELCSEANFQFRKTFIYAFGGVDKEGNSLKICEKYNVKANIWQSMPSLNIARRNATGQTIGDSLYVFGGINSGATIERLNLKMNMQRMGDKFELLDIKLPCSASDIGLLPCLSPQEVLLVGGFSSDGQNLKQILKFQAQASCHTSQADGSQEQVECTVEEMHSEGLRADFFNTNSVVTVECSSGDKCLIFGAQYKHTFTGSTFTASHPI